MIYKTNASKIIFILTVARNFVRIFSATFPVVMSPLKDRRGIADFFLEALKENNSIIHDFCEALTV